MLKLFSFLFYFIFFFKNINAEEKYVGDYTYSEYQNANGPNSEIQHSPSQDAFLNSPGGGDGMLGLSVLLGIPAPNGYRSGYSNNGGYSNNAPVYGNAQYTNGPINNIQTVNVGNYGTQYNQYSNNYWTCVNNYRGQYYYSYNLGYYVCDTRANRNG